MYAVPVIGRLALWSGLVVRLPALGQRVLQLEQDQAALARRASDFDAALSAIDTLRAQATELAQRVQALEGQVNLLAGQAPLNDNLATSVPVALRRTTRDIAALRARIEQATKATP